MKNLILIISVLFVAFGANAQCELPYKPFSDFKGDPSLLNDTLSYLEYNIDKRRQCYIGRTVAEVLADLDIQIKGFQPIYSNSVYLSRIDFILSDNRNELHYHGISIEFGTQIKKDIFKKFIAEFPDIKWVPQHYEFFMNFVVENIYTNPMRRASLESQYYRKLHEKYGKDFNESMIELK